ncbi:DNA-binding protein P3A2 isoform X2 [Aethina tumida]|uniref:DNA-binding protein P3A2 isoform X2 n=1 Tax=Aethina tumida TaxID=116153 RepID=UPI00096AE087|nr:DNA-binding protein P3A2 isoform X2 [Aethina tumida]
MSDTSDLDITSDEEGQDPQRDVVSVTKILRKIIHNVDRIKKVYDGQLSITVRNARPVGNLQPFDVDGFEDVARQLLERIENRFNIYSNWNGRMNLPELTIDGARVELHDMTVAQLKRFITVLLRLTNGRRSPGFGKLQLRPIWWPAELPWRPLYRDGRAPADKNGKPWIEVLRQVVVNCYDFYDKSHLLFPGGRPDGALAPQVYPPVPRGGELAELPHNDEAPGVHMYYDIENLRQAQRPDLQPNVADDNNGAQRDMLMDAPAPAPALGQAPAAAAGPAPAANNGNAVQIKREPGIEAPTQVMTSSGVWLVDVPTHDVIPHKNCITPD